MLEVEDVLVDIEAPLPADVLLFHPTEHGVFLVGTYLLDEQTRERHGQICVYNLQSVVPAPDLRPEENAILLHKIDCDAILDMKWHETRLYVAHSTGSITIYKLEMEGGRSIRPTLLTCRQVLERECLIMSLSVSDCGVLTSHSDGTIAIWTLDLMPVSQIRVAELEVWIQAWGNEHVVYAGSDDAAFTAWDTRLMAPEQDLEITPIFRNRRTHGAGVTAILPFYDAHSILTGSYDDKIRRFDLRNPTRPVQEQNLGGGVWRILPKQRGELAVCCMYDGAKIIDQESFGVIKEWRAHESMVYGGDVTDDDWIGTCSFYDKRVCIWK